MIGTLKGSFGTAQITLPDNAQDDPIKLQSYLDHIEKNAAEIKSGKQRLPDFETFGNEDKTPFLNKSPVPTVAGMGGENIPQMQNEGPKYIPPEPKQLDESKFIDRTFPNSAKGDGGPMSVVSDLATYPSRVANHLIKGGKMTDTEGSLNENRIKDYEQWYNDHLEEIANSDMNPSAKWAVTRALQAGKLASTNALYAESDPLNYVMPASILATRGVNNGVKAVNKLAGSFYSEANPLKEEALRANFGPQNVDAAKEAFNAARTPEAKAGGKDLFDALAAGRRGLKEPVKMNQIEAAFQNKNDIMDPMIEAMHKTVPNEALIKAHTDKMGSADITDIINAGENFKSKFKQGVAGRGESPDQVGVDKFINEYNNWMRGGPKPKDLEDAIAGAKSDVLTSKNDLAIKSQDASQGDKLFESINKDLSKTRQEVGKNAAEMRRYQNNETDYGWWYEDLEKKAKDLATKAREQAAEARTRSLTGELSQDDLATAQKTSDKAHKDYVTAIMTNRLYNANNASEELKTIASDLIKKNKISVPDAKEIINKARANVEKIPELPSPVLSANQLREMRQILDVKYPKETDLTGDKGAYIANIRGLMKNKLEQMATDTGNEQYIPDMAQYASDIKDENLLKRKLGKTSEGQRYNKESFASNLYGDNKTELQDAVKNLDKRYGTNVSEGARNVSLAKTLGPSGKVVIVPKEASFVDVLRSPMIGSKITLPTLDKIQMVLDNTLYTGDRTKKIMTALYKSTKGSASIEARTRLANMLAESMSKDQKEQDVNGN